MFVFCTGLGTENVESPFGVQWVLGREVRDKLEKKQLVSNVENWNKQMCFQDVAMSWIWKWKWRNAAVGLNWLPIEFTKRELFHEKMLVWNIWSFYENGEWWRRVGGKFVQVFSNLSPIEISNAAEIEVWFTFGRHHGNLNLHVTSPDRNWEINISWRISQNIRISVLFTLSSLWGRHEGGA